MKLLLASINVFDYSFYKSITKGRKQLVNITYLKMMDEFGYDVELTYKKKATE